MPLFILLWMAAPQEHDENQDGPFRRFVKKLRGKKEQRPCFHCSTPTTQGPLYGVIICASCQKKAGPWARSAKPCCQRTKGCADLAVYVDDVGFAEAELDAYTRILEVLRGRSCWYCQIVATPLARAVTDWKGKQAPGKTRGAKRAAAPVATNIIGMLLVFMLLGMSTATSSPGLDRPTSLVVSKQRDVWIWQSTPTTYRACWYCELVGTPLARALSESREKQEPGKTRIQVATEVPGRTKKDCIKRFKYVAQLIKNQKK